MNEEGDILGCENKVEFEVTGFRIYGHTYNIRSETPTSGIEVSLTSEEGRLIQTVVTDEKGDYIFDNITSGEYTVTATHPSWVIAEPSSQSFSVFLVELYE